METIFKFIIGIQDDDVDLSREGRVPRFWADDRSGGFFVADFIVLLVGVCFEAIHCIAWVFPFPTHTELSVWRISSVAITAVPLYIPLEYLLGLYLGRMMDSGKFLITVFFFGALSGGMPYILAWMVILVLAFAFVRDLPPGAYETVHWTTFIPHIYIRKSWRPWFFQLGLTT